MFNFTLVDLLLYDVLSAGIFTKLFLLVIGGTIDKSTAFRYTIQLFY